MGFLDHGVQSEGTGLELLKVLVGANEFLKRGTWRLASTIEIGDYCAPIKSRSMPMPLQ